VRERRPRAWGARFAWALGGLVTLVALVVPWVEGCFNSGHGERCGTYIGVTVLGWLSVIPVLLVSVPIVMLFLAPGGIEPAPPGDWRRKKRMRLAGWICSAGVVLFAGLMETGHPWAKTPPGGQPAGWTFKVGPTVMLLGGVVLSVETALYVATEGGIDKSVGRGGADDSASMERL